MLAPGDVYVNADFGYQPNAGTYGAIGDTIWLDADRDGVVDAGEPGMPGVTVALIRTWTATASWDAGEPIMATDSTDAIGQYSFTGLPTGASADYLVWVNDTANVLAAAGADVRRARRRQPGRPDDGPGHRAEDQRGERPDDDRGHQRRLRLCAARA